MKAARRFSGMNCKKIDLLILVCGCGRGGRKQAGVCNTNIFFRPLAGCILKHFSLCLGDILAMAFFIENWGFSLVWTLK